MITLEGFSSRTFDEKTSETALINFNFLNAMGKYIISKKHFTSISFITLLLLAFMNSWGQVNHIVISQVYGGGGNTGATYQNDFVELFNPTCSAVNITGYSLQYASNTGTSWTTTNALSGSIPAGGYYLIKMASGGAIGSALPTADFTSSINMSATTGKVVLVNQTAAITATVWPSVAVLIDGVGFGTATNFEGTAAAPAPSATTADKRSTNCIDNNNNSTDFSAVTPNPRNSATAVSLCSYCNNHTVTFNANGGSGSMSVQTASVSTNLTSNAFTKSGCTFTGWNTAANGSGTSYTDAQAYSFAADLTLYAQWNCSHTVTFNANGGSGSMAVQTASVSTNLTSNGFTQSGCTFSSWNTAANGTGTSYTNAQAYSFSADLTLYAQWNCSGVSHTVTFNANGGSGSMAAQTASVSTNLTSNGFTQSGCTFTEWNSLANGSGTAYTDAQAYSFAADITLYAQWNCSHTVTFNGNGGSGSMAVQTASTSTNLTSNGFTKSGCIFTGWNTLSSGSGISYSNGQSYSFASNLTLYAQWNCSPVCPYLISAVINSCNGCANEGNNEFVVLNTGSYSMTATPANINISYSNGPVNITSGFAAQPTSLATLNTSTMNACGTTFVDVSNGTTTIPANSTLFIINKGACFTGDWSAYCGLGNIYVAFSNASGWAISGFFGNNTTPRNFITNFSGVNAGCGVTTYNYNTNSEFDFGSPSGSSGDGNSVVFHGTTPSYVLGNGNCTPAITILPIELIDFYATQNGSKNDLTWKVATEKNIAQYIIEKSDDGMNFNELTKVKAKNIEGYYLLYNVEDNSPYEGITYYRLMTEEINGKIYYHKIIEVDKSNKNWEVLAYQKNENLLIEFKKSVPKNATISLYDLSGQLVTENKITSSQTEINIAIIAPGIYFAKIETPYKTENFKIVIQN